MKNKLIILLMLLIPLATAYDLEDTLEIKSLPSSGTHLVNISMEENSTVSISQGEMNEHVSLLFAESIYLNNTDMTTLEIEYNIEDFGLIENKTLNTSITFTTNETTFEYGLRFFIVVNETVSVNSVTEFQLINNTPVLTYSIDQLPLEDNQEFTLQGEEGTTTFIDFCDIYLQCPQNITFSGNVTTLNVGFSLPSNLSLQVYEQKVTLTNGNVTKDISIQFNITEPVIIIPEISFEKCYNELDINDVEKCITDQMELQRETLAKIFALARAKQQNFTQIKEVEKLVMVGSVNEELKSLYDSCSSDLNLLRTEFNHCTETKNVCIDDKAMFQQRIVDKENELDMRREQLINETKTQVHEVKQSQKNWIMFFLFIIAMVFVGLNYKRVWEKFNHKKMW